MNPPSVRIAPVDRTICSSFQTPSTVLSEGRVSGTNDAHAGEAPSRHNKSSFRHTRSVMTHPLPLADPLPGGRTGLATRLLPANIVPTPNEATPSHRFNANLDRD